MFFYLAQFLTFLAMPLTIVILLLITGYFLRRKAIGKTLSIAGIILLLFFSNQFISNAVMSSWEPDFEPIADLPEYELGIVLTGVTNLDKTAYDRTFFNKGADRATHAMQLYKMGKIKHILITGGQGLNPTNSNTEAQLLADFMIFAGVPSKDIIIENKAVNTRQNALFAKELLVNSDFGIDNEHLLITSAFHMSRAKACFDKVGIKTKAFPVDYYSHDMKLTFKSLFTPVPEGIVIWHKLFKEWIGIVVYKLVGYI
ncbi:YdcF family protein [Echinicola shivajiensis]|uniref:YdcF family protein n=1 Tax=Echinicola shivajiensis TaxID=1035916 RepID=UPI001BFCD3E9|nr:YdcF family protein [Echinicola shivajiensis]